MTAVNTYKQKQTNTGIFKRETFLDEDDDSDFQKIDTNPIKPEAMKEEDEFVAKTKITMEEPMPANTVF